MTGGFDPDRLPTWGGYVDALRLAVPELPRDRLTRWGLVGELLDVAAVLVFAELVGATHA